MANNTNKSMEQFINQMQAITSRTESVVIGEIGKLNGRIDKMGSYMVETNKAVLARIEKLEEHVIQQSQKCEAPKSVNTKQYNHAAQSVEPIGTCVRKGHRVNFFGICKHCGEPILSPSVIGYCTVNGLDVLCYTCQKGGKVKKECTDIQFHNGKAPTQASTNTPVDTSLVVNCDICGKPRKYKSAADYVAKKNYAESLGLPGTMCTACAKDALNKINTPAESDSTPEHYEDPIAFEKQQRADKAAHKAEAISTDKATVYDFIYKLYKVVADKEKVTGMKIKDVREVAASYGMELGFNGTEWNKEKSAMFDKVQEATSPFVEDEEPVVETVKEEPVDTTVPTGNVQIVLEDGVTNLGF